MHCLIVVNTPLLLTAWRTGRVAWNCTGSMSRRLTSSFGAFRPLPHAVDRSRVPERGWQHPESTPYRPVPFNSRTQVVQQNHTKPVASWPCVTRINMPTWPNERAYESHRTTLLLATPIDSGFTQGTSSSALGFVGSNQFKFPLQSLVNLGTS